MARNIHDCSSHDIAGIFSPANKAKAEKRLGHRPNTADLIREHYGEDDGDHLTQSEKLEFQERGK